MYPYSAIEKLDKKIMGNSCNVSILNPFRIVRSRDSRNNLLAMSVQFTIYLLGCLSISFFIYIPGKYRSGSCDHPSTKRKDMCFTNARHTPSSDPVATDARICVISFLISPLAMSFSLSDSFFPSGCMHSLEIFLEGMTNPIG